jgi:hypothetical protein
VSISHTSFLIYHKLNLKPTLQANQQVKMLFILLGGVTIMMDDSKRVAILQECKLTWLLIYYSYSTAEGQHSNGDGVLVNALEFFAQGSTPCSATF